MSNSAEALNAPLEIGFGEFSTTLDCVWAVDESGWPLAGAACWAQAPLAEKSKLKKRDNTKYSKCEFLLCIDCSILAVARSANK